MVARIVSWITLIVGGIVLWRLFFPAIMMVDSLTQFDQAWRGVFDNWHPPLMAIVLHLFLSVGRNIGALTVLVCLSGLFGIRGLALSVLSTFFPDLAETRRELLALSVVAVLFLPVSPLPFQLITFWKDTWCAVVLVWITSLLIVDLDAGDVTRWTSRARVAAVLVLSAALGLLRHNAVVVLPAIGAALAASPRRRSRAARGALLLAPLLSWGVTEQALNRAFDVQESHLARHLMAFQLVGMCARERAVCDELTHLRPYLRAEEVAARYVPGNLPLTFWTEPYLLDSTALLDGEAMVADFRRAALHHPLLLAEVDLAAFVPVLNLRGPHQFVWWPEIPPNVYGLTMTPRGKAFREGWALRVRAAGDSPIWRYVSGVHAVWLLGTLAWIGGLWRSPMRRRLAYALLPALAFYLSYLLAAPARDYRFMYPATLTVQVWTLSALAGWLATRRRAAITAAPAAAA